MEPKTEWCGVAYPHKSAYTILETWLAEREVGDVVESKAIISDPEILGGTPVFVGTRVPVQTLIDYVVEGQTVGEFLDDFPSVDQKVAIAALEDLKRVLVSGRP